MSDFPETLATELLCDARISLAPPQQVGATPRGMRSIHTVTGGTFDGPQLRGTFHAGGGDWLLSFDGGHNELDVRATLETHDGALIYVRYHGVLKIDPATAARIIGGEEVDASAYYFRGSPRFETGDERYAWLNTLVSVSYGRFGPGWVAYRIFAIK